MSLKPLGDRVLIKPEAAEQKTASGLYIASNAQEKPQRGEVVAVGEGKLNDNGERLPMASSPVTRSSMASSVATRSRSTARITSSCALTISTRSSSSPAGMA